MGLRVLVTGGTGTFGRAFIRRAVQVPGWDGVVSYSRDEMKAAQLTEEFGHTAPFKAFLGDVRDSVRLGMALRGVHVVVHAAALKRVDAGAYSPSELIATNILGTMNVVNAAIHAGVKLVVVLSSDKAVNAINLYGATKYCAETYAVQANAYGFPSGTKIAAVRYGNILGSRGSVYHTWKRQAERGEPLTLTDMQMTRFMMTIEQAVDLVMYALATMRGGEVFIPLLPSAYMRVFAAAVHAHVTGGGTFTIERRDHRPGGEKLGESLLNEEEPSRTIWSNAQYYAVTPTHHEWTAEPWLGERIDPMTVYRSDMALNYMTAEALTAVMAGTEACQ